MMLLGKRAAQNQIYSDSGAMRKNVVLSHGGNR